MAPNVGIGTQGPVQRGWGLWLTSVLAVVIATFFVGARLVQRLVKRSGLGMDDYMIIVALISSGLLSLTECQAVVYGYGRHWKDLDPKDGIIARKWFYAANIMYKVVLMFNKISVVCLYSRVFAVSKKSAFQIACHVMTAWIVTSGMAFIIATIFQCQPIEAFWDRSIPNYKCFQNQPWWVSYATTQITTDFFLLAMPIRQVMTLSMTRAEKIGICFVFSTGGFVTFASIYRATTIAASAKDTDPTWGPIPATIWSVIEANAGIICACLPMLRGPFVALFGPMFSTGHGSSKSNSYQLSWKSAHSRGKVGGPNGKMGLADVTIDTRRDSEDYIIKDEESSASANGKEPWSRPSAIVVTNEFRLQTDRLQRTVGVATPEARYKAASAGGSVNEERPDGDKPFSHI